MAQVAASVTIGESDPINVLKTQACVFISIGHSIATISALKSTNPAVWKRLADACMEAARLGTSNEAAAEQ